MSKTERIAHFLYRKMKPVVVRAGQQTKKRMVEGTKKVAKKGLRSLKNKVR